MEETAVLLVAALGAGLLASWLRLPALVGFLAAGFALNASGIAPPAELETLADLGVTLLLFGIGLKLDVQALTRREVWGTAGAHFLTLTVIGVAHLTLLGLLGGSLLADASLADLTILALALSFSSTVLVVKVLEEAGGANSLQGRVAIGILVIQDVIAVVFLAVEEGRAPSPWASTLLLLWPASYVVAPILRRLDGSDLKPLFGLVMALVPGYLLFDAVGLKGDLGALIVGALLARFPGAEALSKSIFSLKEILLVGFFLSIGFAGLPNAEQLAVSLALLLLLPLKYAGYVALLWLMGLRRRTATSTSVMLTTYSEFGLIVAVAASDRLGDEWLAVFATTVALSFLCNALAAPRVDALVRFTERVLPRRPDGALLPEDRPIDVGDAQALVLGMGRVGQAAYKRLCDEYGVRSLGVETRRARTERLAGCGYQVVQADANDPEFWTRLQPGGIELVVLAMPFHQSNVHALERLRESSFSGTVAVVTTSDQDLAEAQQLGADVGFQIYDGVGAELADRGVQQLRRHDPDSPPP